jgi:hypothetical protein
MKTSFMLGLHFGFSSKQTFTTFTTFCSFSSKYLKGITYGIKKIDQIPRISTELFTCFSSIVIGFFLHQSFLVDYQ